MDTTSRIDYHEWVTIIDEEGEGLRVEDIKFIASLLDNPVDKFSDKQKNWIKDIYDRCVK